MQTSKQISDSKVTNNSASFSLTPTVLLILDGWGQAEPSPANAVSLANMPNLQKLSQTYPSTLLACSGRAVGLPNGFIGNSEVGHTNLGAGRIVYQDMTRIDLSIETGEILNNFVINELFDNTLKNNGKIHFIGLLSDGGVHSHINHLFNLMDMAATQGLNIAVHAFMDGRDTSPSSGIIYLKKLTDKLKEIENNTKVKAELATCIGRYYAMDRDKHWERITLAWNALVLGQGQKEAFGVNPVDVLTNCYAKNESDEFIKPLIFLNAENKALTIENNDGIFFFNFRADRAREISRCFIDPEFNEFDRVNLPKLSGFATLTNYDENLHLKVAFPKDPLSNSLGEIVARLSKEQLRIAETEKYAHVTYFFSCGQEEPFTGETRCLINSPREVATYDLKPEMSAYEVTTRFLEEWNTHKYTLLVCNLANLDMVGHTGNIPAVIKACETVDACLGKIAEAVLEQNGRLFLTADHGNAEEMLDKQQKPQTAHTLNPVLLVLAEKNKEKYWKLRSGGCLGDIAPTILGCWDIPKPKEMTSQSLLEKWNNKND